MILLLSFAFLAGIVTVLSPCILPLLPIILSSADGKDQRRPVGVVIGFVTSFTFFTLFLSSLVKYSGIPAESLRLISVLVLIIFGASLLIPYFQTQLEILFSRLANFAPSSQNKTGLIGGIIVGFSLGLLWTPCVGPILASVISLAITGSVTAESFLITLAYSLGTAVPMFMIMKAGSKALQKVPWLVSHTNVIQKGFGLLMILTAIAIFFNLDRRFQTFILRTFPNYGVGLTQFEDNASIKTALKKITLAEMPNEDIGKTLDEVIEKDGLLAPELIAGGEWFNSAPLQLSQVRGKVVLIDFWTYSCINCQRTFPYLKKWWEKYQTDGLVIIGVHSPEFEFEKSPQNLKRAIQDFGLNYPIMQDNDFATWKAYKNNYWPAKYLIDKNGKIRYTHFGEGDYDETEEIIRDLLVEAGSEELTDQVSNPTYKTYAQTPEIYLGYARIDRLASPEKINQNQVVKFTSPSNLSFNSFSFVGEWLLTPEYAAPAAGSSLRLNFGAKEVYLVVRPKNASVGAFKVFLDDTVQAAGADVVNGEVVVETDRLYKLINLDQSGRHELRLEFEDNNLEIYAFTFG